MSAAYHQRRERGQMEPETDMMSTKKATLIHAGPLLTVLTASRWYASKGIRCGLTRHGKGHWEITPRLGGGHG
jgi:hypothetical protein